LIGSPGVDLQMSRAQTPITPSGLLGTQVNISETPPPGGVQYDKEESHGTSQSYYACSGGYTQTHGCESKDLSLGPRQSAGRPYSLESEGWGNAWLVELLRGNPHNI
jgi:hypothetical protein